MQNGDRNPVKVTTRNLDVFYGDNHAIKRASLDIHDREILALIGPSGCGKSTYLRCLNRMNDMIPDCRIEGDILLDGGDVYDPDMDPVVLRARVGMVAQQPNPFPKSIYDNIAFGPRIHGLVDHKRELDERVETSLQRAGLWDEVKDNLGLAGTSLSGGQQQRLCIARAIANSPEVILMDEPCSALDPKSTEVIEQLMVELSERYSIVIVTHNMQEAERIAHRTAFFHLGEIVEVDTTERVFKQPQDERTQRYVGGTYG